MLARGLLNWTQAWQSFCYSKTFRFELLPFNWVPSITAYIKPLYISLLLVLFSDKQAFLSAEIFQDHQSTNEPSDSDLQA